MAERSTIHIQFPVSGEDTSGEYGEQRPDTSASTKNVRGKDPLLERRRGGSRHGLAKYPNQQLPSGSHMIQCMGQITVLSGDFLISTFEDYNPNFIPNPSTSDPNHPRFPVGSDPLMPPEGSGAQPNRNYPQNPRRRVQLVPDVTVQTNGQDVVLTATVTRQTVDDPIAGVSVLLTTKPPGMNGDGSTSTTNGSGQVTFTVTESEYEGTILYIASNEYTTP